MKKSDEDLALSVALFMQNRGCVVSILPSLFDAGGWEVNYTLPGDMKPQPAVQIHRGQVTFPLGSEEDVVFTFLLSR